MIVKNLMEEMLIELKLRTEVSLIFVRRFVDKGYTNSYYLLLKYAFSGSSLLRNPQFWWLEVLFNSI